MSFFPDCVARVPVSLWGLGVEGVFARRVFAWRFATVRRRLRKGRMGGKFCRRGLLLEVSSVAEPRFAWRRRISYHSDVFCSMSNVVLNGSRYSILARCCQKRSWIFRGRRGTLDVSIFIMRGGRSSTSAVSSACFVRTALSGLCEVVTSKG